ncbi:MAG: tetratricopeptide repeat protein [Synechococcales cyanobacterium CRU_2_2]|nr:tetratricopeptide repeat protein [Synechococcales cyanobacterium CRU_2_2]
MAPQPKDPSSTQSVPANPAPANSAQTAADWCAQAQGHCEAGDFAAAATAYAQALKCSGPQGNRDCQTWNNHGNALSQVQRYAEALAAYDRATALNPSYHQSWFNRGQLLTEMGAYGNALESYDRAIALQPEPVYLHAKADIFLKKKLVAA